jgi:hypothetical protein
MISAESKLRALAMTDPALVADLGPVGAFRWMDRRLPQGLVTASNACVVVQRISTITPYNQGGITPLTQVRLQIAVLSQNAESARAIAADVKAFLASVTLCATPFAAPNFLLNQRADLLPQLEPLVYREILDYRVWNREDLTN